jgi:hypothetical protein
LGGDARKERDALRAMLAKTATRMDVKRAKVVSPTHKRTEGRAPVWGSEFTSKDSALQGGSAKSLLG